MKCEWKTTTSAIFKTSKSLTRGYAVNIAKGIIAYRVNMLRLLSLNENIVI